MLTGRVPPEETLPTALRPAGVRSITEMEPAPSLGSSPSLATKSHRRSRLSARAPWEPTDTTPPPAPPVGTVAARESVPLAALLNTKTELFKRLLSVYTNPLWLPFVSWALGLATKQKVDKNTVAARVTVWRLFMISNLH